MNFTLGRQNKEKKSVFLILIMIFWIKIISQSVFACELLGYSFNETVQARHIFSVFRYRELRDGWGVAYYPDKSVVIYKEPIKIMSSKISEFLINYKDFNAPLLISHVRIATVGSVFYSNTHPFQREFKGKSYVFAHNGTLTNYKENLKLDIFKPTGTTDSEHLLCFILGQIKHKNIEKWNEDNFKWLESVFQFANKYGWMYCLFSDGEYLFAYRCSNTDENRLHYINRKPPYKKTHFKGLNQDVDLSTIYPQSANGIIFSTKPLSDEQWTAMEKGNLIAVKNGSIVFP